MQLPPEDRPHTLDVGPVLGIPIFHHDDPRLAQDNQAWSAARNIAQALHTSEELLAGLRHGNWRVRHECIDRLIARGRVDPRALPALLDLAITDTAWQVRDAVVMSLGAFDAHDVASALQRCRADPHPEVRWSAAYSLSQLGLGEPPEPA